MFLANQARTRKQKDSTKGVGVRQKKGVQLWERVEGVIYWVAGGTATIWDISCNYEACPRNRSSL